MAAYPGHHAHPQFFAHAPVGLASPFATNAETVRAILASMSAGLARLEETWRPYEVLLEQENYDFDVDAVDVADSMQALSSAKQNLAQATSVAAASAEQLALIGEELTAALGPAIAEAQLKLAHYTHLHSTLAPMAETDPARQVLAAVLQKHGDALAFITSFPPRFVFGEAHGGQAPLMMENQNAEQSLVVMRVQLEWSLRDIADYINSNGLHPAGHPVSWNGAVSRMCRKVGAEGPRSTKKSVDDERIISFMLGHAKLAP